MASSGKKGKKNKGTVISLQSFLSNGETPSGTTQVSKIIRNVDGDDSDDGSSLPLVYQLPTAPRANRIFDDESIPHKPPFICYITNLPFDASESDVYTLFENSSVVSLRLPKDDGETGRVRGFGYVEFETRDDLINVLILPDPSIRGRRIRIEVCNEYDQQNNKQRTNRRGFECFGNSSESRDSSNWRRDNQEAGNFGGSKDRSMGRERRQTDDTGAPGSWRMGTRPQKDLSPRRDRVADKSREAFSRPRYFDNADRESKINEEENLAERPKLNLKPRTLPLPEIGPKETKAIDDESTNETVSIPKSSGAAPESVFGSAKPVDTATRELEIEEKIEQNRRDQEKSDIHEKFKEMRLEKTEKENTNTAISWRRKNEISNDNKGDPGRRDDCRSENQERELNSLNQSSIVESSDISKSKEIHNLEAKPKDDKPKREIKPLPKFQHNEIAPVLHSSNKYSGLDDDTSE